MEMKTDGMDKSVQVSAKEGYSIRAMREEDYAAVHALWERIHGFALRSIDDSEEGIRRFIRRNPMMNILFIPKHFPIPKMMKMSA